LSWNVSGLRKHVNNCFVHRLCEYDIVCLYETFSRSVDEFANLLPITTYNHFSVVRQYTGVGRPSGGIDVYIRKTLSNHFTRICDDFTDGIYFLVTKDSGIVRYDTVFCFIYIPPDGSTFYHDTSETNGVENFSHEIYTMCLDVVGEECKFFMAGDFNSRIGTEQDFIKDDDTNYLDVDYVSDGFSVTRNSKDQVVNKFGKSLLSLCRSLGVHVLNGRAGDDKEGNFTFVSHIGKSVNDYIIVSTELYDNVVCFKVGDEDISDHFPLTCILRTSTDPSGPDDEMRTRSWNRLRWKPGSEGVYVQAMDTALTDQFCDSFMEKIDRFDIESAVNMLSDKITQCASSSGMCNNRFSTVERNHQPYWWDDECEMLKKHKYASLTKFRESNIDEDLAAYKMCKAKFKNACSGKKAAYARRSATSVWTDNNRVITDSRDLWKRVKSYNRSNRQDRNNISANDWYKHFEKLLNDTKFSVDESFNDIVEGTLNNQAEDVTGERDNGILDTEITCEEIANVVRNLSAGKAPGPDGVMNEHLKSVMYILQPYMCSLFNAILCSGNFPEAWCEAIISPLHKKGDAGNPNNYRGISLSSVIGKVFTKVLNNRLQRWCEFEDKLHEEQIGYRSGYSTSDNIFVLQSLCQKYMSRSKGRFYCIFIDFSKAFDSIQHHLLRYVLLKNGIHGKLFHVISSMYSKLKSCVKVDQLVLSEYFDCTVGTRQGCMVSPLLFVLFLNELVDMLKVRNCKGIYVNENIDNIISLFYADDIAGMSDTVLRLQQQIDCVSDFCDKYGMSINLEKTMIIVFRRGGIIKDSEKWFYKGDRIKTVSAYKYLGVFFTPKLSWSLARSTLAQQAEKAMFVLLKFVRSANLDVKNAMFLFDRMISPILCYGAEVWGFEHVDVIESVHLKFCRRVLRVNSSTNKVILLGELGRYPLNVAYMYRCIRYWLQIVYMPSTRYPKACYDMLYNLNVAGRTTWATKVKNILDNLGLSFAWLHQGVGNVGVFLCCVKQRLRDVSLQTWHDGLHNSERLCSYRRYKSLFQLEDYHYVLKNKRQLISYTRFRCGNHHLAIECGRWSGIDRMDRICKYCCDKLNVFVVEDEEHFICLCPLYAELRCNLLERVNLHLTPTNTCIIFDMLMTDARFSSHMAYFIKYAFSQRQTFLEK
jgi:exonuclease III